MKRRNAEVRDYYRLRYVGEPDYCAVTQSLAHTVVYAREDDDSYRSEIWVKDLESGKSVRVTAGGGYECSPRLTEDGDVACGAAPGT